MDSVTQLWSSLNSGTAVAAGIELEAEISLDVAVSAAAVLRTGPHLLEHADLEPLQKLVVKALVAQAGAYRPYSELREGLEWVRASLYLDWGQEERARLDLALSTRLQSVGTQVANGPLLERIFSRHYLESLRILSRDGGFPGIRGATDALLRRYVDIPDELTWDKIAAIPVTDLVPVVEPNEYASLFCDSYGFSESITELDRIVETELSHELARIVSLAALVGHDLPGSPDGVDEVARTLEVVRALNGDVIVQATRMTVLALEAFQGSLIALDNDELMLRPQATPHAMERLVTEGEEYFTGALSSNPKAFCFLTKGKCLGAYTLANVLYHELAHCWNMLKSYRVSKDLPPPLRVAGTLGTALVEGIATYREWEVYELYRDSRNSPYGAIFDELGLDHNRSVLEFELDTRIWRLARLIRALFDFRVQYARQPYVEFVKETAARTGIGESRIHGYCFSFFQQPGCAPCYALGSMRLAEMQAELAAKGLARREFNTRASSIGFIPPSLWKERILNASVEGRTTDGKD